ncbi:MAG: MFS transporter [Anaerolineae bacterium]
MTNLMRSATVGSGAPVPPAELTTAEKLRLLHWNVIQNAFNSVFAQLTFFGSAFVLFLDQLHVEFTQIGVLLSLVPFFGIVAIFIAPRVARFGYKRTFLTFWGIRKFITALLLLVPWVIDAFGVRVAVALVMLVVAGFSLCRAIAETGSYPWAQEFTPDSVRGRHAAVVDMAARITGLLAIIFSGFILGLPGGLERFTVLFGVGIVFGLLCVWSASHLPGGAPTQAPPVSVRNWMQVIRDHRFSNFMIGLFLVTLAGAPLGFLPLFMRDQIGLTDSQVVWLQMGGLFGGFSAIYLVGWAADRYGSKPVMLTGVVLRSILPLGYIFMPRGSDLGLPIALLIAFLWGISDVAWGVGSSRLLYVNVVPKEKKSQYLAVYYSMIGIVGGLSSILGGAALDVTHNLSAQYWNGTLDPFVPLFLASIVLASIAGIVLTRRLSVEGEVSLSEFASMFVHGNPLAAMETLIRYNRFTDERSTVLTTERMGQTHSALNVEELLDALKDPRFNVRFEAIISIARTSPDPRLVKALCEILDGTEVSLSVIAAWALGRIGDEHALPALRNGLDSHYRSIAAHCARSLGTLGDDTVAPMLLERLKTETDKGLQIAYSSALGHLRCEEALDTLLHVLEITENEGARLELALVITRIAAEEEPFIRLVRNARHDRSDGGARDFGLKRQYRSALTNIKQKAFEKCAYEFARDFGR